MDGTMAKHSGRILTLAAAGVVAFIFLPLLMADQQDTPVPAKVDFETDTSGKIAAIITCHGMIDNALFESIVRRSEEAVGMGAAY